MSLCPTLAGLGDQYAQFNVYIANIPAFSEYSSLGCIKPLSSGEIHAIGLACGNGWRKVFNVYAKLLFALNDENTVSLQGHHFSAFALFWPLKKQVVYKNIFN
jgi:hypothetical protein